GRFDYVIPIGLPDRAARAAIWSRYIPDITRDAVDIDVLVQRTDGFSPADIEFAARSASQRAFEAAVGSRTPGIADAAADAVGPSTQDYLDAIAGTRTTVSPE
ncbi:ATP-binding protein, partial [Burkholderia sp. SIMBA_024]